MKTIKLVKSESIPITRSNTSTTKFDLYFNYLTYTRRPNENIGVPGTIEPWRHTDLPSNAGDLKYIPRPLGVHALNDTISVLWGLIEIQPVANKDHLMKLDQITSPTTLFTT